MHTIMLQLLLKALNLTLPMYTLIFYWDFAQHIFEQGACAPCSPLKSPMVFNILA